MYACGHTKTLSSLFLDICFSCSSPLWMGDKELLNETFSLCVMTPSLARWHARWRSREVCILLKYFHSLKYFRELKIFHHDKVDTNHFAICVQQFEILGADIFVVFLFKALIDLSASSLLLKRNICGKKRRGGNYLTWQQLVWVRKKRNWCQLGAGSNYIRYTLFTMRQSPTYPELEPLSWSFHQNTRTRQKRFVFLRSFR